MGCEGYVTVQEITGGAHFLDRSTPLPWFRVVEPIAVLYEKASTIGGRINFSLKYNRWQDFFDCGDSFTDHRMTSIFLPETSNPFILLSIVPQVEVMRVYERDLALIQAGTQPSYLDGRLSIGAISVLGHKLAWDRITPGFWVVSEYHECGTSEDNYYHLHTEQHSDLTFGQSVKWELWT